MVRGMDWPVSMTPTEAAQACGVSERAIRGRIERGSLRHTKRGGRIFIATTDLLAAGLLPESPARADSGTTTRGHSAGRDTGQADLVALLGETVRALQEAEAERGRLRGLLESTEARERSEREAAEAAQEEIVRLRAKVMELEAQAAQEAETAPAEPEPVQDIVASGDQARPWWKRMLGGSA